MKLTGEYRIGAPRRRVWDALNDPEVLRQCLPGCESLERVSDTRLTARTRTKVGPVQARFTGDVTLSDVNPPESCTLSGEGKGGAAGFATGTARVRLAEDGAATTVLSYTVEATVGGKLAQLGARLVAGTARKLSDEFFGRFAGLVAPGPVAEAVSGEAEARAPDLPPVPQPGVAHPPAPAPEDSVEAADSQDAAATVEPAAPPPPGAPSPAAEARPADTAAGRPRSVGPVVWLAGIIALVLALILAFSL
jgi:hypothetical protein